MKFDKLKQRLHQDRPKVKINLEIPEDVLKDLQEIAPKLGFSNYQALIRAYKCICYYLDVIILGNLKCY